MRDCREKGTGIRDRDSAPTTFFSISPAWKYAQIAHEATDHPTTGSGRRNNALINVKPVGGGGEGQGMGWGFDCLCWR